jgi:tetratricopeptide (TPR) repeat protein
MGDQTQSLQCFKEAARFLPWCMGEWQINAAKEDRRIMEKPTERRLPPTFGGFEMGIRIPFLNRTFTLFRWGLPSPRKAVAMARKEVMLHPTSADAHSYLAQRLLETGALEEALEEGHRAFVLLSSDPTDLSGMSSRFSVGLIYNLIGLHLEGLGRRKEARSAWETSADLLEFGPGEDARQYLKDFPDE